VSAGTALAATVTPSHIEGSNNDGKLCSDFFGPEVIEIRWDPKVDPNTVTDGTLSVTVTSPSTLAPSNNSIDFTSNNALILGVIVKDGVDGANFYDYQPGGVFEDTYLTTPFNGDKGISHVNFCVIPGIPTPDPLTVTKTAAGTWDRTVSWELVKTVDDPSHVGTPGTIAGSSTWKVVATKTDSGPVNYQVTGSITVGNTNDFGVSFTLDDSLDDGTVATVTCPVTLDNTGTVPAQGSIECDYTASPVDDSATLNSVILTSGDPDVDGDSYDADVAWTENLTGDDSVLLTDPHTGTNQTISDTTTVETPESFPCAAADSALYVNGTYTYVTPNTAFLDGAHTDLESSASVTTTCNQRRISGGHTIGYYFNAPAGQDLTLANFAALKAQYNFVLGNLSFANKTALKNFGNSANCSGTCTTLLQAQFVATAMQVRLDTTAPYYGDQCVAVPTYIEADGVAQIDDLLTRINVLWGAGQLNTTQRVQLQALLNSINNDLPFNLC
jgi:hypothetical protein